MKKIIMMSCLIFVSRAAMAADDNVNDRSYITGALGWYDAFENDNNGTEFGLEYRMSPVLNVVKDIVVLRPVVGFSIVDNGAKYGFVGGNFDIRATDSFYIIPSLAVGAYDEGRDGKDLGGTLEFRSGIEFAYQCKNQHRIGVSFQHTSNADIYSHNPGTQSVMVSYSVPAN